jgi:hypothetical protein
MSGPAFKIQKPLPEKHGSLKKKQKILGGLITRYFKVGWDDNHAVLFYGTDANAVLAKQKKISLHK